MRLPRRVFTPSPISQSAQRTLGMPCTKTFQINTIDEVRKTWLFSSSLPAIFLHSVFIMVINYFNTLSVSAVEWMRNGKNETVEEKEFDDDEEDKFDDEEKEVK